MTDERRTWPLCMEDARRAAWDHYVNPECAADDGDAAHDFADGHHDVIYHFHALDVYADSSHVRDYAEEVNAADLGDDATPERFAAVCLYMALRDHFAETLQGFRDDATHSGSVSANADRQRARLENGNAWIAWNDMVTRDREQVGS